VSKVKGYIFSLLLAAIVVMSMLTTLYQELIIALVIVLLISMLDKLGKGIVLREMIAFHTTFVCLVMPAVGYELYSYSNFMARKWIRYMLVEQDVYFPFALPAVALFALTICLPIYSKKFSDEGDFIKQTIVRAKEKLLGPGMQKRGIYLLIIGVVAFYISDFLPVAVRFVFLLFYFAAFAAVLYVFFSPAFKYKVLLLSLFIGFILANAVRSGMFTIVAYMGITIFSFLFVGKKVAFWKKLSFFAVGAFMLMLIQAVKPDFRRITWKGEYGGNKTELFFDLMADKISEGKIFSEEAFFWIYYRTNQGYNVGLVMRRIPYIQQHDGGKNLAINAASSLVPRFLWPDKPEAGGKFNMKYYAGVNLRGWSTNIGPLGEAYGSFGVTGGIIFMGVLGLFIRWAYVKVFSIARRLPLIVCWLPVLFYQVTYSAETDTLQIMNSLVKSAFFIWLLFKIMPPLLGVQLKKPGPRPVQARPPAYKPVDPQLN
jgi:hypothetical protein